ncbi:hypothetical protein Hanom_Chr11g00968921 [Helianthus anomalus]
MMYNSLKHNTIYTFPIIPFIPPISWVGFLAFKQYRQFLGGILNFKGPEHF